MKLVKKNITELANKSIPLNLERYHDETCSLKNCLQIFQNVQQNKTIFEIFSNFFLYKTFGKYKTNTYEHKIKR